MRIGNRDTSVCCIMPIVASTGALLLTMKNQLTLFRASVGPVFVLIDTVVVKSITVSLPYSCK